MGGAPAGREGGPRWARPRRAGAARGQEGALALALAGAAGAADAQLLASVFLGLQQGLGWPPLVLGALALAEGLAAGVATPLWQRTLGRGGGGGAPARALAAGCLVWGLGTAVSAGAPSLAAFLVVRAFAAGGLSVVSPAAQAFLPPAGDGALGGRLFGRWGRPPPRGGDVFGEVLSGSRPRPWLALGEAGGGLLGGVVAAVLARGESGPEGLFGGQGWRFALLSVAGMAVPAALAAVVFLPRDAKVRAGGLGALERDTVLACASSPAFLLASLQDGLGAVPRSALLFSTMWLQLRGLSDGEAAACSASLAVGHAAGSFLGRHLGELAAAASAAHGRLALGQLLDVLRLLAVWAVFQAAPARPSFAGAEASLAFFLVGFLSACMEIGVNRPVLAAAVPTQATGLPVYEQTLRGLWSALFGAPLVGYLSQLWLGYRTVGGVALREVPAAVREHNTKALGTAVTIVACAAWSVSFLAALPLHFFHREGAAGSLGPKSLGSAPRG